MKAIPQWYSEVEAAGGYRQYYDVPGRGTFQGGGTAGGLGLDHEFMESVLMPQIMLYGFLGFQPTPTGFRINPRLPGDWQSLRITNILHRQNRTTITAYADGKVEIEEVKLDGAVEKTNKN